MSGILTKTMIKAAPVNKLVILALENVIFLNTERLINGSDIFIVISRNMKKVKQSSEINEVVKV